MHVGQNTLMTNNGVTGAGIGHPASYTISRKSNRGDHRFEPLAIGNIGNSMNNPLKLHANGQMELVHGMSHHVNTREAANSMDL